MRDEAHVLLGPGRVWPRASRTSANPSTCRSSGPTTNERNTLTTTLPSPQRRHQRQSRHRIMPLFTVEGHGRGGRAANLVLSAGHDHSVRFRRPWKPAPPGPSAISRRRWRSPARPLAPGSGWRPGRARRGGPRRSLQTPGQRGASVATVDNQQFARVSSSAPTCLRGRSASTRHHHAGGPRRGNSPTSVTSTGGGARRVVSARGVLPLVHPTIVPGPPTVGEACCPRRPCPSHLVTSALTFTDESVPVADAMRR